MGFMDKIKAKFAKVGEGVPPSPAGSSNQERAKQMQNPEGPKGVDNDPPEETTVVR